jgi:hypothetical protein
MTGGSEADTFRVTSGHDVITDFEQGVDHLTMKSGSFRTVLSNVISEVDTDSDGDLDTVIDYNDGASVTLLGVTDLDASDVEFTKIICTELHRQG